ncbi:hypothetical protein KHA93_21865 [Bacillus sp. FJAT-49732]|uniref:Lipoprotein n=1 Tax=Lederbergia citrisecunda TaxID=2833583 RepID=A0A942YN17_9BACI|nr:hypothetical protein [Lederbergia citrisecunda]MBS4202262.1 hypothetical protein [Lederbergia citrisecunda]
MKINIINLSLLTILLTTLISCSNEAPKVLDLNQLTRVDVQIFTGENSDNEIIIAEEEKIKTLREVFAKIDWDKNEKAEMARKKDVKATLFFTFDKNMPERLFEYFIWFNLSDGSATIFDREKNALGTLENKDAQTLKEMLLNN